MVNLVGQRLGNYEITSRFGEGGMATVYKAKQLNIQRDVAIKVILPSLAKRDEFAERFNKEAQLSASLSHPHIIKVFDYGVMRGFHLRLLDPNADPRKDIYYIVMELQSGGSLADKLRKGPIMPEQASQIISQLASALDYAHTQSILHRDLKPGNILFDGQGNAFLTDFGIAKMLGETTNLTQEGTTVGTPQYMSPEQWESENMSGAADNYALGVVLFEMLTGKMPFHASTPYRIMFMHLNELPPSIYKYMPSLPPGIDPIILRAMAKKAEARFETATQFAEAFRDVISGKPTSVLPPDPPSPVEDGMANPPSSAPAAAGNNKAILLLVAVLVVVIVILVVVLSQSASMRGAFLLPQ
jgi:serine/threonine protein kinase